MADNPTRQQLLLPVKPWFIIFSIVIALAINFIPLGRLAWRPDILAVVLVFWCVHQPRKLRFSIAFMLGLCMDVHQGVLLGQHAMAYVLICLLAAAGARRVLWFDLKGQMLHMMPLFFLLHAIEIMLHWIKGDPLIGWTVIGAPLIETLLWPLADWILLAPQRRVPSKDSL